MATTIKIGNVGIRDEDYAITANAILGIRGAGKTYLAKSIAEQMLDLRIPIVVFDPIGQWRHLRRGANARTKGFKVVVAGGEEPDLKLTPATAVEIVRASIAENIPLVIDLYDRKLSKADWRRIVRDTFRTLLYENKGVRHIFLEETAEFAPQKVQDGETYAEVEKLVRMGGNASLGITLINQRAQEVNKAVLDLCENLVLMRQRGAHAITALEKWLDKVSPESAAKITADMPDMETGEAWVFAGSEQPRHTRGNTLRSFHPDRRRPELSQRAGKSVDVATFVAALTEKLSDKSPPETIEALKAHIRQLEQERHARGLKSDLNPKLTSQLKTLATENDEMRKQIKQHDKTFTQLNERFRKISSLSNVAVLNIELVDAVKRSVESQSKLLLKPMTRMLTGEQQTKLPLRVKAERTNGHDPDVGLTSTARRCLVAIAQYPEGVSQSQLAALVGYSTRTVVNQMSVLRGLGYVNREWPAKATDDGFVALGEDYERLPQGDALLQYWLNKLDGTAAKVLKVLTENTYEGGLTNTELAEMTEYSTRTIVNQISELKRRRLVTRQHGRVVPIAELFDA